MDTDETKGTQDEKTSEETKGTSGKETPTFTDEQAQVMATKAVSDALSAAGRTAKALEVRELAIKKTEENNERRLVEAREAELEANRDNPDELPKIQKRHREEVRQAKLDKREQELEEREAKSSVALDKVTKAETKERAQIVATKHDVDVSTLEKHTDGSLEAMEDLAKSLPKKGEAKPPIGTDSGKTTGSGSMPNNLEDFKAWAANLSQSEYESKASEIDERLKELQK